MTWVLFPLCVHNTSFHWTPSLAAAPAMFLSRCYVLISGIIYYSFNHAHLFLTFTFPPSTTVDDVEDRDDFEDA